MNRMIAAIASVVVLSSLAGEGMQVNYYRGGKMIPLVRERIDSIGIERCVRTIVRGTTDMLRLYVDTRRIRTLKETETVVEIVFNRGMEFESVQLGRFQADRVIVPLSGDFVGRDSDPVVTLFLASGAGVISGPLRNHHGLADLRALQSLVESAIQK